MMIMMMMTAYLCRCAIMINGRLKGQAGKDHHDDDGGWVLRPYECEEWRKGLPSEGAEGAAGAGYAHRLCRLRSHFRTHLRALGPAGKTLSQPW